MGEKIVKADEKVKTKCNCDKFGENDTIDFVCIRGLELSISYKTRAGEAVNKVKVNCRCCKLCNRIKLFSPDWVALSKILLNISYISMPRDIENMKEIQIDGPSMKDGCIERYDAFELYLIGTSCPVTIQQ